jgi:hypothetical protein
LRECEDLEKIFQWSPIELSRNERLEAACWIAGAKQNQKELSLRRRPARSEA